VLDLRPELRRFAAGLGLAGDERFAEALPVAVLGGPDLGAQLLEPYARCGEHGFGLRDLLARLTDLPMAGGGEILDVHSYASVRSYRSMR
jgi:hypothetical protein